MAHTCANCGQHCTCQGDWDDVDFGEIRACIHCDGEEENDDGFFGDDTSYPGTITPSDICRSCGCHNYMACTHPDEGACWWAEVATIQPDGSGWKGPLCSFCAMKLENVDRPWQTKQADAD